MYFFTEGGDDDEQKGDHPAGAESGDYALPEDIGQRIGEGEKHTPQNLGDE